MWAVGAAEPHSIQELGKGLSPSQQATVYIAREMITMNPEQPKAEAVAVGGGRILAVGNLPGVKRALGDQPYVVDRRFEDKVIVAGFLAQHVHPFLAALTLKSEIIAIEDWVLPTQTAPAALDHETYMARLRAADRKLEDPEAPLVTWGYHQDWHGELTREELDSLNSTRPILVWHRSCHEFYLNTPALKKYGLTSEFVSRQSESAQESSDLKNGHFWEQGVFPILPKIAPALATPERFREGLEFTRDYMHGNGVTLACEPGGVVDKGMQDAINAVMGAADAPFRFYFIADGKTMAQRYLDNDLLPETEKLMSWGQGRTAFLPKRVKLFSDGAMYSQTMQMIDGYTDGHAGEWIMDPDVFASAFRKYWDAGYQIHIHQNGDKGLELVLDNLEQNMRRNPRDNHRTLLIHFGFSTPEQVVRAKKLGAMISANPYYVKALADRYSEKGLGPERAQEMVRLGEVERQEIPLSLHSDMPMAPGRPLFLVQCAVTRRTAEGHVAGPDERITLDTALRGITINAALHLGLEDEVGSIEVGKRANFTILEQSPLSTPIENLAEIPVWGTVEEGRVLPVKR